VNGTSTPARLMLSLAVGHSADAIQAALRKDGNLILIVPPSSVRSAVQHWPNCDGEVLQLVYNLPIALDQVRIDNGPRQNKEESTR
jgi:hypothetical protein